MRCHRRHFLKTGLHAALLSSMSSPAFAAIRSIPYYKERLVSFHNIHTGEKLDICYFKAQSYQQKAFEQINYILRDHRVNKVSPMDPYLMDILYAIRQKLDTKRPFEVISGYRSPETNALLRKRSGGVAKVSLHMQGKAIDIRVPGFRLSTLHKACIELKRGGVGYYPDSNFVHVDTGRIRYW